jgi:hypothetical protein
VNSVIVKPSVLVPVTSPLGASVSISIK